MERLRNKQQTHDYAKIKRQNLHEKINNIKAKGRKAHYNEIHKHSLLSSYRLLNHVEAFLPRRKLNFEINFDDDNFCCWLGSRGYLACLTDRTTMWFMNIFSVIRRKLGRIESERKNKQIRKRKISFMRRSSMPFQRQCTFWMWRRRWMLEQITIRKIHRNVCLTNMRTRKQ